MYKPVVKTSKLMFYQTNKSSGLTQRNLTLVPCPQTTAKTSNSFPHVTSSTGAPLKEGELCCYKCMPQTQGQTASCQSTNRGPHRRR